jgi:hypothetical protein
MSKNLPPDLKSFFGGYPFLKLVKFRTPRKIHWARENLLGPESFKN